MLVHKELVEKIYQHRLLIKEAEFVGKEIHAFVLKDSGLNEQQKEEIRYDIEQILKENAVSDDSELAIAKLDLILAKVKVAKLTAKKFSSQPADLMGEVPADNVVIAESLFENKENCRGQ